MANFVFNIAKGRVVELYDRVDANDPSTAVLTILVVNTTETDDNLGDLDTLGLVIANANTAEVTNTNYARIELTDTDLAAFAPDDGNNRIDLDIPDQTFTAIQAGTAWTDLLITYDAITGSGTDGDIIPLTQHDFAVTPDGSDITAQIDAAGFFRAS